MPKIIFDFVDGAAGSEGGKQLNQTAIDSIRLQPRVLVNIDESELIKPILGYDMGLPFGIAPMGMCNLTWPNADLMLADEAKNRKIPLCLSTASSTSMEDIYQRSDGMSWFQLYLNQSVEHSMQMVDRVEKAGYEVLILTVDVPKVARRIRDAKNGFEYPFKIGPKQFIDFASHPNWSIQSLLNGPPKFANFGTSKSPKDFSRKTGRSGADWSFLKQLRERWKGKLIIKGVLSTEDAIKIKNAGADAIYVSNHGRVNSIVHQRLLMLYHVFDRPWVRTSRSYLIAVYAVVKGLLKRSLWVQILSCSVAQCCMPSARPAKLGCLH
jgi:isopentenyl diphosphate isomerase/L-lactate dehydrogenase-like FMN-dependent dehydrogenase